MNPNINAHAMEQGSQPCSGSFPSAVKNCIPEITVVIPVHNYGRFLGEAIESVLSQDFADIELIILNNASTDNTDEVVKRYLGDARVRYIVQEENIGALANYQMGFDCAQTLYLLFLSADDFLLPGALSALYKVITSEKGIDFVYAKYLFVDGNSNVINNNVNHPGWLPYDHKDRAFELADLLQFDCYISMPTVLFKREVLKRFGEFSDKVKVGDYELFLRLAAGGCVSYFLNEILVAFRLHGNQMSVGGDVISSGSQVNDQLTLLEMYVTEQNFPKLAGCEAGIVSLLVSKLEAFNSAPNRNMKNVSQMQSRIQAIISLISRLQTVKPQNYPMVSVIVPTFNRPDMLMRAVQSILSQTYPSFEIIVINDGGNDVEQILNPLNTRDNIRYIRHETTMERSAARNTGLRAARGKYIAYLDDDDSFYPNHLSTLVNFMESHEVKVAYTDAYRALEEIENNTYVVRQRQLLHSNPFDPNKLLVENLFPILCVMHQRKCINEVGMFDETLQTHEDWEMWLRLSRLYCFHHIPVVTAEYSYRNDKTNTTTARPWEFYETRERVYWKYRYLAQLNPAIIEAQHKALERHSAVLAATSLSIPDFMNTFAQYAETNQIAKAVSYYDEHRKAFRTTPELEEFDSLVVLIRNNQK